MRKFILVLSLCLFVSMGVHVEKALSDRTAPPSVAS